jgi:hypothetical protein
MQNFHRLYSAVREAKGYSDRNKSGRGYMREGRGHPGPFSTNRLKPYAGDSFWTAPAANRGRSALKRVPRSGRSRPAVSCRWNCNRSKEWRQRNWIFHCGCVMTRRTYVNRMKARK